MLAPALFYDIMAIMKMASPLKRIKQPGPGVNQEAAQPEVALNTGSRSQVRRLQPGVASSLGIGRSPRERQDIKNPALSRAPRGLSFLGKRLIGNNTRHEPES